MADIVFDIAYCRERFKQYADETIYSNDDLQAYWDVSIRYVSDDNEPDLYNTDRSEVLYLLTAHFLYTSLKVDAGQRPGLIDKIKNDMQDLSLVPVPTNNAFDHWLATSPYGQQLLFLLMRLSRGGFYAGGSPVTEGFRGPDGDFGSYL